MPADENELIAAFQRGSVAAGEQLVDLYWDRVYSFAYRLSLNQFDAEDIAQETFLRALSKISDYAPTGKFGSWLIKIASNIFTDSKKASRSRDITGEVAAQGSDERTPDKALEQKELVYAVEAAMMSLSKEQRTVLLLKTMEHLEYNEIASMLNTKEATVRWYMHEARRVLRQKLSKRFDLESMGDEPNR